VECPAPTRTIVGPGQLKKRGRQKKTKARNLLERLRDYEEETLRFMNDINVPFTNNPGENDIFA
jgi:transposase